MRQAVMWSLATLTVFTAQTVAAQRNPVTERATDDPDKFICKTFRVTGSLVQTHRECGTKRDWEIRREELMRSNVMNSCRLMGEGGQC